MRGWYIFGYPMTGFVCVYIYVRILRSIITIYFSWPPQYKYSYNRASKLPVNSWKALRRLVDALFDSLRSSDVYKLSSPPFRIHPRQESRVIRTTSAHLAVVMPQSQNQFHITKTTIYLTLPVISHRLCTSYYIYP